jgi:hypothetical protein
MLDDGEHRVSVIVHDPGEGSATTERSFKVDNHAPTAVEGLAVDGGDGWRSQNGFTLAWRNRDQGAGAPIAAARYKVGSPPTSPADGVRVAGTDIARVDGIEAPGDGEHTVWLWTEDEAGNADHTQAVTVRLRLDRSVSLAFAASQDPDDPALVRAPVQAEPSGIASGLISYRRAGASEWTQLDTKVGTAQLTATFPDERVERGSYELVAWVRDNAGNQAWSTTREDGRPMLLEAPLRLETQLDARLARGIGRASARRLRVGYGKPALLRARLRTIDGAPLSRTPVAVEERTAGTEEWRPLGTLVTDSRGAFSVRVSPGPTREFRARFEGTRRLLPARGSARLRVRGRVSLRLSRRRLRRGQLLRFAGAVGKAGAQIPPEGKLFQIQFLDGRRWRPAVELGRTDSDGRYRASYRFRRIRGSARVVFRVLVPHENRWPYLTCVSSARAVRVTG